MLISVVLTGVVATCAIDTGLDQTSIDRTFKPAVQDCRGYEEISSVCPGMGAACQRAEWVDGRTSATLAQTLGYLDDYDGRQIRSDFGHGDLLMLARRDSPLTIAGRETAVSRLRLETPLSFGVPQRLASLVPIETAATENMKTAIVKEQIVASAALQPQRAADEPLSSAMRTFPAMGSALSFLVWSAAIFIFLAAGVGLSRGLHQ